MLKETCYAISVNKLYKYTTLWDILLNHSKRLACLSWRLDLYELWMHLCLAPQLQGDANL